MNPESEEQNDLLLQEAMEAETLSDWVGLRGKCDQGLRMEGLAKPREAIFRRLRAKALFRIAIARKEAYNATLLQEAMEDAKKVAAIYSNPKHCPSYIPTFLAQAHAICGDASYALVTTPSGSGRKGELIAQAIDQFEKCLQLEPQYKGIRKMLDHVKQHPAAPKEQKSGCFIATAACGNPYAPEVVELSAFRDDVLSASAIGRAFIRLYYAASPSISAAIAQSATLRRIAMVLVVRPAVWLVRGSR